MSEHVILVKDSVRFDRIAPAGFRILAALDRACKVIGCDLVITCGTEAHDEDDPHTLGEAYDVRVRTLPAPVLIRLYYWLTAELGPLFTVLYEVPQVDPKDPLALIAYPNPGASSAHLHIQRKKGTVYPPEP